MKCKENIGLINKDNLKNCKDNIGELLFLLALIIEVCIVVVDKSALINPIEGRLFQITFILCALKIALTKYNVKEWLLMATFVAVGLIVDQITDRNEIVRFVAFVAASKGINKSRALKLVFYFTTAGMLCLVGLSLLGILGDVYLDVNFYRSVGVERRYCLGLGHPNALHCMFWALVTLGMYLYFDSIKWYHYALLLLGNIGLFLLSDSRTGMLITCLSIVLGFVCSIWKNVKNRKSPYILAVLTILSAVGFSIVVACFNGMQNDIYVGLPTLLEKLDSKMTGRILAGGYTGSIRKWKLFSDSAVKGYLDMGYIKLFYWYGIVVATMYVVSILLMVIHSMKKKDISAVILIVSFSLYTIAEAHIISPYFARNYVLMLFFGNWSEVFFVQDGTPWYFWQINKLLGK